MPLPASSRNSAARLDPTPLQWLTPLQVHEELRLRKESRERDAVERDFEKLRRQQTGRGGLINFVRYFWHSLEPKNRPLIEGWPLEAICVHLEALTFGDIPSNRLLINVPPGFTAAVGRPLPDGEDRRAPHREQPDRLQAGDLGRRGLHRRARRASNRADGWSGSAAIRPDNES
jgi:hypothetical protein